MSNIQSLIAYWQNSEFIENVAKWEQIPPTPAQTLPFPEDLNPILKESLINQGIHQMYSHQICAWDQINSGKNVVISTGTASGKTICYDLPVIASLMNSPNSSSIYLFPTKALTVDQLTKLHLFLSREYSGKKKETLDFIVPSIYDGDTSVHERNQIRSRANILLTNPDMLHLGILPHHTLWERIFRSLNYVVIDEIHFYRGIFGSHLANVLRRLKRIASFYGSKPHFIMTSATVANAKEFAQKLIEEPVELIEKDGSSYGKRNIILYNPPVINKELGLRNGMVSESVKFAGDLLDKDIQTIFFARSRKTVEITLRTLQNEYERKSKMLRGYRSGYLPKERRKIEEGLRSGSVRTVVSTNALELGIDMGSMDAIVLMGFPGSIAAFRQQAGRAGRKQGISLALLIASSSPLDQFIMQHPEYLLEKSPENALINPDNPLILLSHLKCAVFELPFIAGESFGNLTWEQLKPYFDYLGISQIIYERANRFVWMANEYPANEISLRSASTQPILLQSIEPTGKITIGEIDFESANWMVHPGAIYLHEGNSYFVRDLKINEHKAELVPSDTDYYTEPKKEIEIQKLKIIKEEIKENYFKNLGEIIVTTKVTGFQRIQWITKEILGNESLNLPPVELRTIAYWLTLPEKVVDQLRENNLWNNDRNKYGPNWEWIRNQIRQRDRFTCQICGAVERGKQHHVHHKIPYRAYTTMDQANQFENLITLCDVCHQRVEQNVRIRSGLSGLSYALCHLAPVILMCDEKDLGEFCDPQANFTNSQPTIAIYDQFPGGIGLAETLYDHDQELIEDTFELVSCCQCMDGCPSCVGPGGENGFGGKEFTLAILSLLMK